MKTMKSEKRKQITIRMTDREINDVKDMTKVFLTAPAVMSIVRKEIEEYKEIKNAK